MRTVVPRYQSSVQPLLIFVPRFRFGLRQEGGSLPGLGTRLPMRAPSQPHSPSVFQQAWKLAGTVPHFAKGQSGPDEGHGTCPELRASELGWAGLQMGPGGSPAHAASLPCGFHRTGS